MIDLEKLSTFPKHFHDGSQERVEESQISDDPIKAIHQFMDFVQKNSRLSLSLEERGRVRAVLNPLPSLCGDLTPNRIYSKVMTK